MTAPPGPAAGVVFSGVLLRHDPDPDPDPDPESVSWSFLLKTELFIRTASLRLWTFLNERVFLGWRQTERVPRHSPVLVTLRFFSEH